MKKIISIAATTLTLAVMSHSAFAQGEAVQKSRAEVQQELTQAKSDGTLQHLNRTVYRGGGR